MPWDNYLGQGMVEIRHEAMLKITYWSSKDR
jgi:hypothetical protein